MRIRPFAALSVAAASALLLAGCSSEPTADPSPSAEIADLCAAAAPSGAASESVTIDGETGAESTATFEFPLEIPELQRTVVAEGSGDVVEAGQLISYALSAFDAETGEKLGAAGYGDMPLLPAQISADNPIGQVFGCATPGTRIVATFPSTESAAGGVYIFDFLEVVPNAAWGASVDAVDGMPEVELAENGAPTITIPDTEPPTEVQLANLKEGDGIVVESGDGVLVQYTGVKWSDGTIFDSTWEKGGIPTSFQTTGVVEGFKQALEGQKVGSQVLVVIPPAFGYGEGEINDADLVGETLVFVVDILGTQHVPAA